MNRPSVRSLLVLLLLLSAIAAFGQETPPEAAEPGLGVAEFQSNPYEPGDGLLSFRLGAAFAVANLDLANAEFEQTGLNPGAVFSISYLQVVSRGFAIGGELGGLVAGSIAGRTLFVAPLSFRASWFKVMQPFEIVPSVAVGLALVRLEEMSHIDLVFRGGADWLWRQSADWSLGLRTELWLVPEFYPDPENNRLMGFLETSITATYHL